MPEVPLKLPNLFAQERRAINASTSPCIGPTGNRAQADQTIPRGCHGPEPRPPSGSGTCPPVRKCMRSWAGTRFVPHPHPGHLQGSNPRTQTSATSTRKYYGPLGESNHPAGRKQRGWKGCARPLKWSAPRIPSCRTANSTRSCSGNARGPAGHFRQPRDIPGTRHQCLVSG